MITKQVITATKNIALTIILALTSVNAAATIQVTTMDPGVVTITADTQCEINTTKRTFLKHGIPVYGQEVLTVIGIDEEILIASIKKWNPLFFTTPCYWFH